MARVWAKGFEKQCSHKQHGEYDICLKCIKMEDKEGMLRYGRITEPRPTHWGWAGAVGASEELNSSVATVQKLKGKEMKWRNEPVTDFTSESQLSDGTEQKGKIKKVSPAGKGRVKKSDIEELFGLIYAVKKEIVEEVRDKEMYDDLNSQSCWEYGMLNDSDGGAWGNVMDKFRSLGLDPTGMMDDVDTGPHYREYECDGLKYMVNQDTFEVQIDSDTGYMGEPLTGKVQSGSVIGKWVGGGIRDGEIEWDQDCYDEVYEGE